MSSQFDEIYSEIYGEGEWREEGVTTRKRAEFCRKNCISLRVLHKNALVYKSCEKRNAPVIVYHIWGDHAFFYDHKYGAHQLPEKSPEI